MPEPVVHCGWSDLPVYECDHCPADTREAARIALSATLGAKVDQNHTDVICGPQNGAQRFRTPRRWTEPASPDRAAHPTVKVATNLTAIVALAEVLDVEAIRRANDRLMPGGHATVALAGVANLEAWANLVDTAERYALDHDDQPPESDDADWEPPLQTLLFWSEDLRRVHDQEFEPTPHRPRPTIASEANFIRWQLDWMWDNERKWDDFATDIRDTRTRLENLLRAGVRPDRSRVVCRNKACENPKVLIRVYGKTGEADHWRCPFCRADYDEHAFKAALAKQMYNQGAARWVQLREAVDALTVQGWQERTVMRWVEPLRPKHRCTECGEVWAHQEYAACPRKVLDHGEVTECGGELETIYRGDREAIVRAYCEVGTHRTLTWWPDLWIQHLTARQERDIRQMRAAVRGGVV
ncbi:MAG TPA: hypothetical protein VFJ14_06720 [Nocardioidaceae bacterium]|nr:hypothetical protein [Nocardioidaceae bacterium]